MYYASARNTDQLRRILQTEPQPVTIYDIQRLMDCSDKTAWKTTVAMQQDGMVYFTRYDGGRGHPRRSYILEWMQSMDHEQTERYLALIERETIATEAIAEAMAKKSIETKTIKAKKPTDQ